MNETYTIYRDKATACVNIKHVCQTQQQNKWRLKELRATEPTKNYIKVIPAKRKKYQPNQQRKKEGEIVVSLP